MFKNRVKNYFYNFSSISTVSYTFLKLNSEDDYSKRIQNDSDDQNYREECQKENVQQERNRKLVASFCNSNLYMK